LILFNGFPFKMGGKIAGASNPFCFGVRCYGAESPFGGGYCPGTALALIDDRMATAAIEIAPFSCHESALDTLFQGYALHFLSSNVLLTTRACSP
jgi:hypothetical protein